MPVKFWNSKAKNAMVKQLWKLNKTPKMQNFMKILINVLSHCFCIDSKRSLLINGQNFKSREKDKWHFLHIDILNLEKKINDISFILTF